MRDSSFDDLARGLASGSISRGKAIRLMGAALLGGTLASMPGVALADDECKRDGKKCRKNKQCCSGNCSGGTCQAQTTTTTTSTSTSTTSTSTTPGCVPNGATCTEGVTPCCSGNCNNGVCTPQNRINCGCQNGFFASSCTSTDCSDTTATTRLCTALCLETTGTPFAGGACIHGGC